jgi:hypothetical protein
MMRALLATLRDATLRDATPRDATLRDDRGVAAM